MPTPAPVPEDDLQARILALEGCAFRAWPALEEVRHGGWVLRLARGFTKRANSANAVDWQAPFDGVQAAAEALYARHGLPAVFRLTPLAPPGADARLAAAGYARFDPSCVMARPLDGPACAEPPPAGPAAAVDIAPRPGAAWLDGFAAANGVPARHQAVHHAMVRAIALPAGFATLYGAAGAAIGFGLAAQDGDAVGLYDIVVAPAHRRRGHGAALVRALLGWGRGAGARQAYLQVREQNPAAVALYAGLGFRPLYRYHYRVPPLS